MNHDTPQQTVQRVREALQGTFAEVRQWFALPDAARSYRPQNGSWTIDEILEHITLTNHYLLKIIRKGCDKAIRRASKVHAQTQGPAQADEAVVCETCGDLDLLEAIGQRGAFPWIRPEHMEPTGSVPKEEVLSRMEQQLAECLDLLDRMPNGEGAYYLVRMTVNDSGKIDMYQWLYFLAQHARRHLSQMRANETERVAV